ncbi:hypothetical protein PC114_g20967 [Phytophthora cactorum]|nr:hypothetical protein PC114_g20967 [Phytophthora cactorum]
MTKGSPSTLSVAPTSTSELVREKKSAATTYINCETPVALSAKTLQGCQLLRVLTEVPRGSTGHSSVTTDWGRYYEDYVTALSALRYKDKIIIDLSADAGFGGSFGRL